jgi:peptidyl-prolyl cis-trans isomerase B (cyclophilin B)
MANSGPNTNGSQFFIMLDDTFLPPAYTIFGQINEADFAVLDKIKSEVNPSTGNDGKPNKELKMVKVMVE